MIDFATLLTGICIGTGTGVITMGLFAGGKYVDDCRFLLAEIADRDDKISAKDRRIAILKVVNTALHQELDVHVKRKLAADAQRREAGKLGNAAQAARKISKDAQAKLIAMAVRADLEARFGASASPTAALVSDQAPTGLAPVGLRSTSVETV